MSEGIDDEAKREPTDEELLAIEASRREGAPDGFDPEGGDER